MADQLLGFACQWASRTLKPSALGLHLFIQAPLVLEVRAGCNIDAKAFSVWSASLLPFIGAWITTQQCLSLPSPVQFVAAKKALGVKRHTIQKSMAEECSCLVKELQQWGWGKLDSTYGVSGERALRLPMPVPDRLLID